MSRTILNAEEVAGTLDRLAGEILGNFGNCEDLVLIGIQRRGVDLAARLKDRLDGKLCASVPMGSLDINLYRDDWTSLDVQPMINRTEVPFDLDGRTVILVDDVLFTGRTIRAALEALLDFGRPRLVQLLTLVDRGHRELPIQADYVGVAVDTDRGEHVNVYVSERDGRDEVALIPR